MTQTTIHSVRQVRTALETAKAGAAARGLPLTPERIAACLGMSRQTLLRYIEGELQADSPSERTRRTVQSMLRQAWWDCNAELAEELLKPGSHSGAVFLGKNNFGYADKADNAHTVDVTFVGENDIAD